MHGFTSVDRMSAVLGNFNSDNIMELKDMSVQMVVPGMNFSCSGRVLGWVFAAHWVGSSELFTELQIWRPTDEDYVKVGATSVMTAENGSRLYEISLSSPLEFQAGDIVGFHQPEHILTQLRLMYESVSSGPVAYHFEQHSPQTEIEIEDELPVTTDYHVLLRPITGKIDETSNKSVLMMLNMYVCMHVLHTCLSMSIDMEGCGSGFMSVERMRILLGLDHVKGAVNRDERQQISPAINFSCTGLITHWVVGADWSTSDFRYPEIQLWRRVGNESNTYRKIHGTFLRVGNRSDNNIYQYGDFVPISFEPGDIVGMFLPRKQLSRLRVKSEDVSGYGYTNYFVPLEDPGIKVSPVMEIDLDDEGSQDVESQDYLPLISVCTTHALPSTSTVLQSIPRKLIHTKQIIL